MYTCNSVGQSLTTYKMFDISVGGSNRRVESTD